MEKEVIRKTIINQETLDQYFDNVLLYEINDLKEVGLTKKCKVFRSARYKDELPSVFEIGQLNESLKDCEPIYKDNGLIIKSDSLTILGDENNALFICFMGGKKHLVTTEIHLTNNAEFVCLKVYAEVNRFLKPNEEFELEELEVFLSNKVNDSIVEFAKRKASDYVIRNKKVPVVYSTYNYYGKKITFNDCIKNLEKILEYNLDINIFEIDNGWEKVVGNWTPNKKFPNSLEEISKTIKSFGLIAGLWTSPFIAHKSALIWKINPSWKLKNKDGKPITFRINNVNYYIVDISIPSTWYYFKSLYQGFVDAGFMYHKLDYTSAFLLAKDAVYANKYITLAQAYHNACAAIRLGMGQEAYFTISDGLYDTLIGIVDSQNTCSTALSMWNKVIPFNLKSYPMLLKQNLLRSYMNYWWYNEANTLSIRKNYLLDKLEKFSLGLLNEEEIKTVVINQLINAGSVNIAEALDKISFERLTNLTHILPIKSIQVQIPKLLNSERYPNVIRLIEMGKADRCYAVYINYSDEEIIPKIKVKDLAWNDLTLNTKRLFVVSDFYGNSVYRNLNGEDEIELKPLKPHACTIVMLSASVDNAIFDGHFLMRY